MRPYFSTLIGGILIGRVSKMDAAMDLLLVIIGAALIATGVVGIVRLKASK